MILHNLVYIHIVYLLTCSCRVVSLRAAYYGTLVVPLYSFDCSAFSESERIPQTIIGYLLEQLLLIQVNLKF